MTKQFISPDITSNSKISHIIFLYGGCRGERLSEISRTHPKDWRKRAPIWPILSNMNTYSQYDHKHTHKKKLRNYVHMRRCSYPKSIDKMSRKKRSESWVITWKWMVHGTIKIPKLLKSNCIILTLESKNNDAHWPSLSYHTQLTFLAEGSTDCWNCRRGCEP